MTNKPELTDERIAELFECVDMCDDMSIDENADMASALRELQQRRLADKNCFMHGIADPDGKPYLDEFCVSSDQGLMEDEASALNDTFETDGYRAVALYTALPLTDSERTELQERRKADSAEPVFFIEVEGDDWIQAGRIPGSTFDFNNLPDGINKLYASPQPAMKDHQIRELVNDLRDIAIEYHGTQQLRERIARTVRSAMLQGEPQNSQQNIPKNIPAGNSPATPDGWIPVSERMPESDGNYWGWWSESKRQGPVWFIKSDLQAQFQSSEITHWMPLPAAPQQEVKS